MAFAYWFGCEKEGVAIDAIGAISAIDLMHRVGGGRGAVFEL
jgi:hypothetical protein